MKTKISITIALFLLSIISIAQTPFDALKFSETFNSGTARFTGMGGAFGALGGDFSSLSLNPAGLGVYRTSEFTFTPTFKSRSVSSDYNGSNGKDTRNLMNIDNLGFVLSFKPNGDSQTGLVNLNLAFGYNRTNDYNTYAFATGDNNLNSIQDYLAGSANGINYNDMSFPSSSTDTYDPFNALPVSEWESIMAWNTFLIDTFNGNNNYVASLNPGDGVLQRNRTAYSGSSGDYVFSVGANFSNKLYVGTSISAMNINYSSSVTYSEDAFTSNGTLPNGNRFYYSDYFQTYDTKGSGFNMKLGAIYKPIDGLRLGLAFHTPTYYNLQDNFSYSMSSNFDIIGQEKNFTSTSPNSRYDYKLETPFRTIASIAYIFKDLGLLSMDIERVNYSSMRFRQGGDGYDYMNENETIQNTFKTVNNIKIGGEIRFNDFFVRGGYALYPSPYKSGYLNQNANRSIISGGLGYRSGTFFVDAAYQYSIQKEKYVFYQLNDTNNPVNPVSAKMNEGKFLVTIGFKF